jgi:hypothetical protein
VTRFPCFGFGPIISGSHSCYGLQIGKILYARELWSCILRSEFEPATSMWPGAVAKDNPEMLKRLALVRLGRGAWERK